ncbi:MAG: TetM/TetW/TetO/TetS family tetracycline resistance ribosomal protection protein [Spirochaetales bacterium]|nr:TetM/TetW/TetO/TetS family tetracycline resistance ribosomal protection protein [Spirochaetales bacterium]
MKTINIGIFAHVDAGKTTITENILFESGAIKRIGRVDDGNTQTDQMEIEKRRGISVKATPTSVFRNDLKINIIDTPGHSDFISEVERSMIPLDGAILVLSAKEGIQPSTRLLFDTLVKLKIPAIIFINKIDRTGVDIGQLVPEMQKKLSAAILPVQQVSMAGGGRITLSELFCFDAEDAINRIGTVSDEFITAYLEKQKFSRDEIISEIMACSRKGLLYPVLFGSALKSIGVNHLLDAIGLLLPVNSENDTDELSGVVFKVNRERITKKGAKHVFLRLYGGTLHVRQPLGEEKVTSIMTFVNGQAVFTGMLCSGDIGAVTGLNSLNIGDTIGNGARINKMDPGKPALKARLVPQKPAELARLAEAVKEIAEGDPHLGYELDETDNELYVNLFGKVQMEVLKETLETQYGIAVAFGEEILIYRETVKEKAECIVKMNIPGNPYIATIGLKIEPNTPGGGIEFRSEVSASEFPAKYLAGVRDGIHNALKQGIYGWEIDDIKVTLTSGEFDIGSTRAGFRELAGTVLMEAVSRAKTKLLWPICSFELRIPEELLGKAFSDLSRMMATFDEPLRKNGYAVITGVIPAESSRNYDLEVISYTSGRGSYTARFHSYRDAPANVMKTGKKSIQIR